mmetsp:Transcript_11589/g.18655  ORF Transcript_11589/g.18655 Transcript_11589/m.18655 type:complete len:125 (-) Transcript_11589:201-575(-)
MVLAAVIGGLSIVGGPSQARAEKADRQRLGDLQRLSRYLDCRGDSETLPQFLSDETYCPERRTNLAFDDPVTDDAYVYRRLSDDRFQLCARFASQNEAARGRFEELDVEFDGQLGCVRGRLEAR